ncbi:MAG: hypothetical protein Ct9H90mP8_0420 [Pseudomonadota bacterium]|nr:MAG: hypothetical protein Ct9H90mP8_0420 [Pseudomonadota bacterium]
MLEAAKNCKALVAGTENLLPLIEINPDLKMIARVGIGLEESRFMSAGRGEFGSVGLRMQ